MSEWLIEGIIELLLVIPLTLYSGIIALELYDSVYSHNSILTNSQALIITIGFFVFYLFVYYLKHKFIIQK